MMEWKEQVTDEFKLVTSAITMATTEQQLQITQLANSVEQLKRILEKNSRPK